MKTFLLLQSVAVLVICSAALAADLNAPGEKKVTVRTEIGRGCQRIMGIPLSGIDKLPVMYKVIRNEKLTNTDSDGFYLGAYMCAWLYCARSAALPNQIPALPSLNPQLVAQETNSAEAWFRKFREKQWEMQITDRQAFEAIGEYGEADLQNDVYKSEISNWSARTRE